MTTRPPRMRKAIHVATIALVGLTTVLAAGAEADSAASAPRDMSVTATDIGTLGGTYAIALGINDQGFVTGYSALEDELGFHAFVWDPTTEEMTDLGTLGGIDSYATGINSDGVVTGYSYIAGNGAFHAFVWDPVTAEMTDLGTLDGAASSAANGINDAGVVVGSSVVASSSRAWTWDPVTEEMTDIGDLGGGNAIANAINDDGVVVGLSIPATGSDFHAFVWEPATGDMDDLGTLGGPESRATAISDNGLVAGTSYIDGGTHHAFVWDPATDDMTDLGTLGGTKSWAYGINDDGIVVGNSFTAGNLADHATAWDARHGHRADLGSLGGSPSVASAINDAGVAVGYTPVDGLEGPETHPLVWTPPFVDVPLTHPFAEDIVWLVDNAITTGYDDDTFRPANVVTRQATAAFLYRSAGAPDGPDPTCTTAPFTDVPVDHPFCGEIEWASDNDITTGYPDGTFKPAGNVTRQAFTAFLYRMAGAPDGPDPTCTSAPFTDVAVSHPFCGEIEWASDNDITTGYPNGTFKPANTVTRQATAAFLHRFADLP